MDVRQEDKQRKISKGLSKTNNKKQQFGCTFCMLTLNRMHEHKCYEITITTTCQEKLISNKLHVPIFVLQNESQFKHS